MVARVAKWPDFSQQANVQLCRLGHRSPAEHAAADPIEGAYVCVCICKAYASFVVVEGHPDGAVLNLSADDDDDEEATLSFHLDFDNDAEEQPCHSSRPHIPSRHR